MNCSRSGAVKYAVDQGVRLLALTSALALLTGCPPASEESAGGGDKDTGLTLTPTEPIPTEHPLLAYGGLWLGMNAVDISQAYNAPEGLGDGFTRGIERYGDVAHHTIRFDLVEGEPRRKIVASLYRDQLYFVVDRREGFNAEQARAWLEQCVADYGEDRRMTIGGAQWVWGSDEGVSLTFTQDNASEDYMNGTVVLKHEPTRRAAHDYLVVWEEEHPPGQGGGLS